MKRMNRSIIRIVAIYSLLFPIGPQSSFAEEGGPQRIVIYKGTCSFEIVMGFFPCDNKVVYTFLKNGRSMFVFMKEDKMFTLVGGKDRQPNLENYYVALDKLIINKGKRVEAVDQNMEGECHINMNREATKFFSIKCDIYNRTRGILMHFFLEDIKSFSRKEF
jgi:hypothetical protein